MGPTADDIRSKVWSCQRAASKAPVEGHSVVGEEADRQSHGPARKAEWTGKAGRRETAAASGTEWSRPSTAIGGSWMRATLGAKGSISDSDSEEM